MDKPIDAFAHSPGLPPVARVDTLRPLHWLARGWKDFTANPGPSVAHGFILVALGWLILLMCSTQIDLLAAAVSGFLLVGPVFGAGFYELSRLRASGQRATFDELFDLIVLQQPDFAVDDRVDQEREVSAATFGRGRGERVVDLNMASDFNVIEFVFGGYRAEDASYRLVGWGWAGRARGEVEHDRVGA